MLVETVVLGMVWLILTRRSHRFKFPAFKGLSFIWLSVVVEQVADLALDYGFSQVLAYTLLIHLLVYLSLGCFFVLNLKIFKEFSIMGIGMLLNFIVIVANSGFMPVSESLAIKYGYESTRLALANYEIFGHALLNASTKLVFLSDWIAIGPPYPFPKTISIGDVFIDIGILVLVYNLSRMKTEEDELEVEDVV